MAQNASWWKVLCPRRPLQKTVGFKNQLVKLLSSLWLPLRQLLQLREYRINLKNIKAY